MKVYWCNIQPHLADPSTFIQWCSIHQIPLTNYLCISDAIRHFTGRQLCSIAKKHKDSSFTNISHSGTLVLCACSQYPIGIDAEEIVAVPSVPSEFFTDEEYAWMKKEPDPTCAFFRLWTRKEGLIKARGGVLADIPRLPSLVQKGALLHRVGTLQMQELAILPARYCVSICFEKSQKIELITLPADQIFIV